MEMAGSPHINVPHIDTQAAEFDPATKLPENLRNLQELGGDIRKKMEPFLQRACALMDSAALRTAALPQPE